MVTITFFLLFLCCGKGYPNSNAKLVFIDVLHYIEQNYNFNPLLFLGSSVDCLKPRLNFSHCSLNHSSIGCLFMVSTSLLSSVGFFSTLKTPLPPQVATTVPTHCLMHNAHLLCIRNRVSILKTVSTMEVSLQ